MAIIKCKMCGGDIEISADKTFGTCEYCGSTMTLPKVDDEQRAAAFQARIFDVTAGSVMPEEICEEFRAARIK